ncbi:MAG: alpha-amylase, partial [Muribaculaceae bacterium]|nr:alpha-amylase [Muribaculaceae bacterium]
KETLLIVANFDEQEVKVSINLPDLAIGMAGIAECKQKGKDLLWGKEQIFTISHEEPAEIVVGAMDAVVIPLKKRL